mmetsp:Transcript_32181/g.78447  ORF Transcript_32181/g.78447 Transcript_32181/m.78447 type:complete len:537 (-) Transcript_32181:220-1830(-)
MTLFDYWEETTTRAVDRRHRSTSGDEENVDANVVRTSSSSSSSSSGKGLLPSSSSSLLKKPTSSKAKTKASRSNNMYSTAPAPSSRGLTNRKHPWPQPKSTSTSTSSSSRRSSLLSLPTTVQNQSVSVGEEPKKEDDQNNSDQNSRDVGSPRGTTTTTTTTDAVKPTKSESAKTINLSVVTTTQETTTTESSNTITAAKEASLPANTTTGSRQPVLAGSKGLREIKKSSMTTITTSHNKFKVQMAAAKFNKHTNAASTNNFVKTASSSSLSSTTTYVPGINNNNTNKGRNVTSKPWTTETKTKKKTSTTIKTTSAGLVHKMLVPAAAAPVATPVPVANTATSSEPVASNSFTPTPVDEPAAYLVYEPDSSGRLVEHYVDSNQTPTSNNNAIIGRWTASKGKKIATFKLKRNAGRNVLQGSCSAGVQGRKNYCAGWCQFVKSAYVQGSDDVTLWDCGANGQKGMPVDVYLYYNDDDKNFPNHPQTMKLTEGVPVSTMNLRAVAAIPKNTPFYESHVRIGLHKWLQDGNNHGYSSMIC